MCPLRRRVAFLFRRAMPPLAIGRRPRASYGFHLTSQVAKQRRAVRDHYLDASRAWLALLDGEYAAGLLDAFISLFVATGAGSASSRPTRGSLKGAGRSRSAPPAAGAGSSARAAASKVADLRDGEGVAWDRPGAPRTLNRPYETLGRRWALEETGKWAGSLKPAVSDRYHHPANIDQVALGISSGRALVLMPSASLPRGGAPRRSGVGNRRRQHMPRRFQVSRKCARLRKADGYTTATGQASARQISPPHRPATRQRTVGGCSAASSARGAVPAVLAVYGVQTAYRCCSSPRPQV